MNRSGKQSLGLALAANGARAIDRAASSNPSERFEAIEERNLRIARLESDLAWMEQLGGELRGSAGHYMTRDEFARSRNMVSVHHALEKVRDSLANLNGALRLASDNRRKELERARVGL